ncbi:hypothetical protein LP420_09295 [Massilia sp. B-10]|nr:hypothetical protein LP420_09295 [Massilia sp. B-10]
MRHPLPDHALPERAFRPPRPGLSKHFLRERAIPVFCTAHDAPLSARTRTERAGAGRQHARRPFPSWAAASRPCAAPMAAAWSGA